MLYICIYNEESKKVEYQEEYPTDTPERIDWAIKNSQRLEMECVLRRPAVWTNYFSKEKQFAFGVKK